MLKFDYEIGYYKAKMIMSLENYKVEKKIMLDIRIIEHKSNNLNKLS